MSSSDEFLRNTVLAPLNAVNSEALGAVSPVRGGKRKVSSSTWFLKSTTSTPFTSLSIKAIDVSAICGRNFSTLYNFHFLFFYDLFLFMAQARWRINTKRIKTQRFDYYQHVEDQFKMIKATFTKIIGLQI